jgi:hypothetical protein
MRKRNMLILVVLEWYIDLDPSNVEMALSGAQNRMAPFGHHMKLAGGGARLLYRSPTKKTGL